MSALLDQAAPVRPGEELDVPRLEPYLQEHLGPTTETLSVAQFPSGHSNLTYLLHLGEREFVLRRPPFGSKVRSAHDMGREYTVLSHIHDVYPQAPRPLLHCEDDEIIGVPFYVMERIPGVIFRAIKPKGLDLTPELVRRTCEAAVHRLADLHAIDWEAAGLGALRKPGSFVERQVEGWAKRYDGSRTDDIPRIEETFDWLKGQMPADVGACLIHNDYKFDNFVLDPNDITRVIGVLDWEMSTIGDPLMDLGTTLGYWINPGEDDPLSVTQCFFTKEEGSVTRIEFAELYAARTGREVSNLLFYYVFALMKLAVIVQQIYYRYRHGLTQDARFAIMIEIVRLLGDKAARVIESEKV